MIYRYIETPFGEMMLAGDETGLKHANYGHATLSVKPSTGWKKDNSSFKDVEEQLNSYFAGELRRFELTLAPEGTDFQMKVWEELRKIPWGVTRTYGELAEALGNPGASRAVGSANGRNPLVIIQPCHRVIGSNGTLTGFAYGTDMKRDLLVLEGLKLNRRLPGL